MKLWFSNQLSLWQHIFILLCMIGLVIGSLAIIISNIYVVKHAKKQVALQNERVLSFLVAGSMDAMIAEDRPVLETLIDQVMAADPEILKIKLLNEAGQVLLEKQVPSARDINDQIGFSQDIAMEGELFGSIELYWNVSAFSVQVRNQVRDIMILITLTVFILTLSVYVAIKRNIVEPISRINHKLLQLSGRTRNTPLDLGPNTAIEFKNLAETVNSLQQSQIHREQILSDLEVAKAKMEDSNKAKSKFLAVMSHELRTPINGIMGMAEILKEDLKSDEHGKYLDVILESTEILLKVVGDILDFSQLEKRNLHLAHKPFSLSVLRDLIDQDFSQEAKNKKLDFKITGTGLQWMGVIGDLDHLKQVLDNLLTNAFKFTPEGTVNLNMDATEVEPGIIELRVEVLDTGIGIAPEDQKGIFTEFNQLDDGFDRQYTGLGLGLALSQRIVRNMGGEISVESSKGEGSRFFFALRLKKAKVIQEGRPYPELARSIGVENNDQTNPIETKVKPKAKQAKRNVLLVEDSSINQEVVKAMLKDTRFEVAIVQNGREAVDFVSRSEKGHLHAILMDISTPEMDGIQATQKIRALDGEISRIPIIALTAHAFRDDKDFFLASGVDDYLSKPVKKSQLLSTLTHWVPYVH